MPNITEVVVAIEATGVQGVLTALKDVEGANAKVVASSNASNIAQKTANDSTLLSLGAVASKVIGVTSLVTGFMKVGEFVGSTVTDWADYADSMRLGAELAGISVTEMSKLVQAADDYRVPIEKMQSAMEMALKNGFVPTIDNLVTLSDRLLAIEDPAERAAEASDIFGKSYADMMPFLLAGGDAIRKSTSAVSDNLIATEESAAKAKEYKDALDELSDAWTGLKNNAGQVFLPIFISIVTGLSNALDTGDGGKSMLGSLTNIQNAYDQGAISKERYEELTRNVYLGFVDEAEGTKIATESITEHNKKMSVASDANGELVMNLFESTNSWEEFRDSARRSGIELGILDEATYNAEKGITSLSGVTDDWTNSNYEMGYSASDSAGRIIEVGDAMEKTLEKVKLVTDAYEEQKNVLEEGLTDAQLNLTVAISTYHEGVAGSLVKGLKDAGLEGQEMIDRLMLIDDYAGTNYTTEYKMELEIPELLETLINDPDSFADATAAFDNMFLPLQTDVLVAQGQVDALQKKLEDLERQYNIDINITTTGSLPNAPTDNWSWSGGGTQAGTAIGGPVYPGQTRTWNEPGREGEMLIPSQYGRVLSNHEVAQVMREAIAGGGDKGSKSDKPSVTTNYYYTLNMPTSNNPADVGMAFDLMKSLGGMA
jgi:predicted regulator of Ras-like GTPase activity (Roadblock/LC7/MglB family)